MNAHETVTDSPIAERFAACRDGLEAMLGWLDGPEATAASHSDVETRLQQDGRELLRLAFQGHLDGRAGTEVRVDVLDAAGVPRNSAEPGHERTLATVFGDVVVCRIAYRRRGHPNLHPADATLNLPAEAHSHGLRHLAAVESCRGSFHDAVDAIGRATGTQIGKRQVEALARRAAADFADFYATRQPDAGDPGDVLVISADGKGIVMRPDALRPATAHAAANANQKLETRLSKGEKRFRKRLAEVGAVYDITPTPRTAAHILPRPNDGPPPPVATARNKWLTASVADDAATVICQVFDEAERRDPDHQRTWVGLVDGNNHQIDRIRAEASRRSIDISVVIDFIHVLEYLWKAAWSFHDEADPAAEAWVRTKAFSVLNGRAKSVAGSIRRHATNLGLDPARRSNADICATYLTNKAPYLDYANALKHGWPIATGIIEGACRHLVKDRMDITGARWGLEGAEAVLKLRALRSNGDFADYWHHHLSREHQRIHKSRYAHNTIPQAA